MSTTFSESEIVAVLLEKAAYLDGSLLKYRRRGEYGYRANYSLAKLQKEIEHLRGAYSFAAELFRSKDRESGHTASTHEQVFAVIHKAQARVDGKKA